MVYARKMIKNGYAAGRQAIYSRAFELYRYAMGIVIAVLVAQMFLPGAYTAWYNWLGYTTFDEPLRLAAIATFLFQPTFMRSEEHTSDLQSLMRLPFAVF